MPGQDASLFAWDFFHAFHLGLAKTHICSCLAVLSDLQPGSNIDARFEALSADYAAWHRSSSYLKVRITKDFIGWPSRNDYPVGSWHKAGTSTSLLKYLEHKLTSMDLSGNVLLARACEATVAANSSTRMLYRNDNVFMDVQVAMDAGELGLRFLRRYAVLAKLAHEENRSLWGLIPKAHALHHIYLTLVKQASQNLQPLHPLTLATQQDEDYVGRPSRLSRRVDVRQLTTRVLQTYLTASYKKYVDEGLIIAATG